MTKESDFLDSLVTRYQNKPSVLKVLKNEHYSVDSVHGEFDLLVIRDNGRVTYVEYKTTHSHNRKHRAFDQIARAIGVGMCTDGIYVAHNGKHVVARRYRTKQPEVAYEWCAGGQYGKH